MSSSPDAKKLSKLIDNKSKKACLAFLAKLEPKRRRALAGSALQKVRDAETAYFEKSHSSIKSIFGNSAREVYENARICFYATASLSEIRKQGSRASPNYGSMLGIAQAVNPEWIGDWVNLMAEEDPRMYGDIRMLYEAGFVDKPGGDAYILGMISTVGGWFRSASLWPKEMSLSDRIRANPDIRDHDVWRLFEIEGNGEFSLASFDKYIGGKKTQSGGTKNRSWADALKDLSEDGTLSRTRLLDASLDALDRDFAQFRAGWFSRFHEHMAPTLDERKQRRERYLKLLGSTIAPTVSFALKSVVKIDKAKALPPNQLLEHIRPVFQARAKGTVITALRLLGNAATREPDLSASIALVAVDALIHESSDVQHKTLELVESLYPEPEPDLARVLSDYADSIAPSLKERFNQLAGEAVPSIDTEYVFETQTTEPEGIEPVQSFDEFHKAFLQTIEDPGDPLDVERMLDGLARYGNTKPDNFDKVIGPLRKRARAIVKTQPWDSLRNQLACLALVYTTSDDMDDYCEGKGCYSLAPPCSFENAFFRRNVQLLKQLKNNVQLPLLSAPTDRRGFVAASSLVARYALYKDNGVVPGDYDIVLALMRLAPEGRDSILADLESETEYEKAIGYALGADVKVGETGWLWVAAAAARLPYEIQPEVAKKHGYGLPDAGVKASYSYHHYETYTIEFFKVLVSPAVKDLPSDLYLASLFHLHATQAMNKGSGQVTQDATWYWQVCGAHVNMLRWSSTVWPLNLEPFFNAGESNFSIEEPVANTPVRAVFEPMLESHVVLGKVGATRLTLGLVAKDTAVSRLALDALVTSIEQDRVKLNDMQQALVTLLPNYAPVGRWTRALKEVAVVSEKHMLFIRDLIERSLRHDPTQSPRGLAGLVELLYEYSIATNKPVTDEKTLAYLRGVTGSGKLKQFARKLLAQT